RSPRTHSRGEPIPLGPRSPPENPGSEGPITVRASASRSRNGTHRGRPPNPARKPILGPDPLRHTRVANPLMSMLSVSGSFMLPAFGFRLPRSGLTRCGGRVKNGRGRAPSPAPPPRRPTLRAGLAFRHYPLGKPTRRVLGGIRRRLGEVDAQRQSADLEGRGKLLLRRPGRAWGAEPARRCGFATAGGNSH